MVVDLNIEKEKLDKLLNILESHSFDLDILLKLIVNKIIKEGSLEFLTSKTFSKTLISNKECMNNEKTLPSAIIINQDDNNMRKSKAISLFREKGYLFNNNVTFASKNKTAYNYWANPNSLALNKDWSIILNDWDKKQLHLFQVPKNTFYFQEFVPRNDIPDKIDLQIMYNDTTFTDTRSKVSFSNFYIETISY